MGIFSSFFKKENSKEDAKNRLKLVLIQDRAMLPSGVLVANIPILKSSNREVTKTTKQKRK